MDDLDRGRELAQVLAGLAPQRPTVERHKQGGGAVDVLVAKDTPTKGVTTLATVSMSSRNAVVDDRERDFGVELVTCHGESVTGCVRPLVDAAMYYTRNQDEFQPGTVLPHLVERHGISRTMKHFFLIAPFIFDGRLTSVRTNEKEVRYLLAVPISDEELAVAGADGSEALDRLLEEQQIDIYDWHRASVAT